MIKFMIVSTPRCGTTWASNWLTTETTTCLHDLSNRVHYSEWDNIESKKTLGVACTAIGLLPDWLNKHPAKKVILHKPLNEVNESLHKCGFPSISPQFANILDKVEGLHVDWKDLFNNPEPIWNHLIGTPFDKERHDNIKDMNVQNIFAKEVYDYRAVSKLMKELLEIQ